MARNFGSLSPMCKCGIRSTLKTFWMEKNPSRRFLSCGGEDVKSGDGRRCSFFEWVDPEMCKWSLEVIPGLLRRIRAMEEEIDAKKLCLSKYEEKNLKLQRGFARMKFENGKLKYLSWGVGLVALLSWFLCIFMIVSFMDCFSSGKEFKMLPGNGN